MKFIPIIDLANIFPVNDWFLLVMMVTLLLMLILMGPYRYSYIESISDMFRFKNPDGDVSYPLLSTVENVVIFLLSCNSIGVAVGVYSQDLMEEGSGPVIFLLWYSSLMVALFLFKLMLYTIANKILYNRQIITLKPERWNCFYVMSFSVAALLILGFSFLVVFLDIPLVVLLVFAYLMRFFVVIGRIFKIRTSLFKNRRSNLGFIMYLCAFEIAPIIVEFMISGILFGLI